MLFQQYFIKKYCLFKVCSHHRISMLPQLYGALLGLREIACIRDPVLHEKCALK